MSYKCKKCGFEGSPSKFRTPHKKGKDKHDYYDYCKTCHVESSRESRYKNLYNISTEEYNKILELQGGTCAICNKAPKKDGNRLAVDHCHTSGLVRGLLCWACNKAVGEFKDDHTLLWTACMYLFFPPAIKALGEKRYGVIGRVSKKAKNRKPGGPHLEPHTFDLNKFMDYISQFCIGKVPKCS